MSAVSLGGGGVEAEAGETKSEEEEDRASEGGEGGGGETLGFGVEEMEEAEWVKGEDEGEGASTVAAVSVPLLVVSGLEIGESTLYTDETRCPA